MPTPLSVSSSATAGRLAVGARSLSIGRRPASSAAAKAFCARLSRSCAICCGIDPEPRAAAAASSISSLHLPLLDLPRQQLPQLFERPHRRHLLQLERAGLGVGEEVGDQPLEAADLAAGDRQQPLAGGGRAVLVELLLQHLHVEVERVERVADLVREPGGEGAEVGQPLGLGRLHLQPLRPPQRPARPRRRPRSAAASRRRRSATPGGSGRVRSTSIAAARARRG